MQTPSTSSPQINSRVDYTPAKSLHGESTSNSEDDMDWEEVNVRAASQVVQNNGAIDVMLESSLPGPSKPIEITLDVRKPQPVK